MQGIPFDFTAEPVIAKAAKPRKAVAVRAMTGDRDACEIRLPRVQGYRVDCPMSTSVQGSMRTRRWCPLRSVVGPSITHNAGIIGEGVDLNLIHRREARNPSLANLNHIRTTTTVTGLRVHAELVVEYHRGIKISDAEFDSIALEPHDIQPLRNYPICRRS
jgi:hypothetical protein